MISSLRLKHFKRHADTFIQFTPGLNVVVGENGSGKSTLLKAALYCLFGSSAVGRREHLTTWQQDDPMEAELDITLPKHGRVLVSRSLRNATVAQDDRILASGQGPVTKFIEEALGMNMATFKILLLASQGETQALLKMGAVGLQRQLETIAKVGIVDQVLVELRSDITVGKELIEDIGELPDLHGLKEAELTAEEDYLTSVKDVEAYESSMASVEAARAAYAKELREIWEPLIKKLNYCQGSLKVLEDSKAKTEERIEALNKSTPAVSAKEAEAAMLAYTESVEKEKKEVRQVDALRTRLIQAQTNLSAMEKEWETWETQYPMWQDWRNLVSRLNEAKQEQDIINQDHAKVYAVPKPEYACSTCGRPYGDTQEEQESLMKAVRVWEADRAKADHARDSAKLLVSKRSKEEREFLEGLPYPASRFVDFEKQADFARYKLEEAKKELEVATHLAETDYPGNATVAFLATLQATISLRVESYEKELRELTSAYHQAKSWEDRKGVLTGDWHSVTSDLKSIMEQMASLPENLEEEVETRSAELARLTDTLQGCLRTLGELKITRSQLALALEQAKLAYKRGSATTEQYQDKVANLTKQNQLQDYLRTNRNKFIGDTWEALTEYASHLLGITTEGLISNLRRTGAGDFIVDEEVPGVPVDELSGARQSIVGLCLRIALGHLFYGDQGFLLLDEVTADCTEENSARIAGMLTTLHSQSIMITHRRSDAMNAANLITL